MNCYTKKITTWHRWWGSLASSRLTVNRTREKPLRFVFGIAPPGFIPIFLGQEKARFRPELPRASLSCNHRSWVLGPPGPPYLGMTSQYFDTRILSPNSCRFCRCYDWGLGNSYLEVFFGLNIGFISKNAWLPAILFWRQLV